jgi:hypothetical protein
MDRASEYRKRAEELERRAEREPSEIERSAYLKIARGWRELERGELRRQTRGI